MSTTSSIDDYAAIAARLNEIEGKVELSDYGRGPPVPVARDRKEWEKLLAEHERREARQEFENQFRRQALKALGPGGIKGAQARKVMCPTCMDIGYVRRPAQHPGYYVEEACPNCNNPNRKPPP